MWDPTIGDPVLAGALVLPVTVDPDVVMAFVAPESRGPDISVPWRGYFDHTGCGRGDFDIDQRRGVGQGNRG